jgi:hypothetical protein
VESVSARSALFARVEGGERRWRESPGECEPSAPPVASFRISSIARQELSSLSVPSPVQRDRHIECALIRRQGGQGGAQKFRCDHSRGAEAPRNSNVARIWVQAQRPPPSKHMEGTSGDVGSARRWGSERIEKLATKLRLTNQSRVTNAAGGPMGGGSDVALSRRTRRR